MATGDPRYLRQVQLDDDVKRLTALQRAHTDAITRNSRRQSACERRIPQLEAEIAELDPIVNRVKNIDKITHIYTVAGRTYAERKHAAPAFADALRQVFIDGKQRGLSKPVTVGAINGVDILAARSVFDNTLHLSLAVPSRVRELSHRDLFTTDDHTADAAAKARGLLARAENLYAELADHRSALIHEKAANETELDQLRAIGHQPFEHSAELDAKRTELDNLTLQLRLAANSDAAKAEAAAATERMDAAGRTPGWSLLLNPTPAVLQEVGVSDADALRRILHAQHAKHVGDTMRGTSSTRPDPRPASESADRRRHTRRPVEPPRRTGGPAL